MRFSNKIALVTGGTSGIGLATAKALVGEQATVVISGREAERARAVAEGFGAEAFAADMADTDAIAKLMTHFGARHGRIDVLVINAGVSNAPDIADLDPARYAALMDVNCRGAVFTFVHALPLLAEGAAVVFVGSVAGRKGQPGDALYAGSKGFIRAFARSLGTDPEIMARGIRVNVVSPGPIATPLTAEATGDPEADAYVKGLIPMRRWGRAEEVADAILFLASLQSSFITGADITADGGMAHA